MADTDRVLVLNGPNLDRLGTRQPEIYGTMSLADIERMLAEHHPDVALDVRQTNDEATLIGWMHEAVDERLPVILNPAAFTHYSYALRDAAALVTEASQRLSRARFALRHALIIPAPRLWRRCTLSPMTWQVHFNSP